ncbi:thioredoxin family protein [Pseudomonas entomophila]|uniref:thioredoxin family protein n=1 Tax=Pseudomonas entomophila TaxID=312306 RepID=UPI001BCAC5BD|nr:thioredoxin family protein [Pseudomonas entomophila]QVM90364.1 thioredoxin family protein [Pseudomonas entomophila]
MAMVPLTDLEALISLVIQSHQPKPCMVLIHSDQCPPCMALHPKLSELASDMEEYAFYAFNVDTCAPPWMDYVLTLLFKEWDVKYLPTQVLLATGRARKVIFTTNLDTIKNELVALDGMCAQTPLQKL